MDCSGFRDGAAPSVAAEMAEKLGPIDPYFQILADAMVTWIEAWDEINSPTPVLETRWTNPISNFLRQVLNTQTIYIPKWELQCESLQVWTNPPACLPTILTNPPACNVYVY
ncbi:hypothetical protein ACS0TY_022964 [Phlomoides rotata]